MTFSPQWQSLGVARPLAALAAHATLFKTQEISNISFWMSDEWQEWLFMPMILIHQQVDGFTVHGKGGFKEGLRERGMCKDRLFNAIHRNMILHGKGCQ